MDAAGAAAGAALAAFDVLPTGAAPEGICGTALPAGAGADTGVRSSTLPVPLAARVAPEDRKARLRVQMKKICPRNIAERPST